MHVARITPADIAAAMRMTETETWTFAKRMERWFKPTREQLIAGKLRPIDALYKTPKKKLRLLHRWFQSVKSFHPVAHGGVRRRSCFTSARRHLGRKFVWTRDASNCYPSIAPEAFKAELKQLGFRHDTAILLTLLCTVRGYVPQGSPVSSDALNLFLWRLDQSVASFSGAHGLAYTRVADDFVLSGNGKSVGDAATRQIERDIEERGVRVNDRKRRKSGFQDRSSTQLVHSIRVENRRGTGVSSEHHRVAIALAASYVESCRRVQPDSLEAVAAKRQRLHGYLHYSRQATFSPARHLKQQLATGDRLVAKKLKSLRISAYRNKWWLRNRKRNEPHRIARIWRER